MKEKPGLIQGHSEVMGKMTFIGGVGKIFTQKDGTAKIKYNKIK